MNPLRSHQPLLNTRKNTPPSSQWDSALVRELINENSDSGSRPSSLLLGLREAAQLRKHLGSAFGSAAVQSLKNTYYMGLQIVEDTSPSLICVAGRKAIPQSTKKTAHTFPQNAFRLNTRWQIGA